MSSCCFIHYEGRSSYDEPVLVTEKTMKTILAAKKEHEKTNDQHVQQCHSIPAENYLTYTYHRNPCYSTFTKILRKSKSTTCSTNDVKKRLSGTRTSNKKVLKGLSPLKRSSRKCAVPQQELTVEKKRLRSFSPASPSDSSSPLGSPVSRNKFLFGPECQICKKIELRSKESQTKGNRSLPVTVTTTDAALKIKESAETKSEYRDMYYEIAAIDLIASEFKLHKECRKALTRPLKLSCAPPGNPIGDINKLISFIDTHVIDLDHPLGMGAALRLYLNNENEYDVNPETLKKRRKRLKEKLLSHYGDKIFILQSSNNIPDVIISASSLYDKVKANSEDYNNIIKTAAKYIRDDIEKYCDGLPPTNWPPTVEELMRDERLPPTSVTLFLTNLLKHKAHVPSTNKVRMIESYAADFVHGVSNGKVITLKHYLLGLGLHSITGQKKPIQFLNRFGHSISYDKVMEIETAQAQKAQNLLDTEELSFLPLKPASSNDRVMTIFWADNFDKVFILPVYPFLKFSTNKFHYLKIIRGRWRKSRCSLIASQPFWPVIVPICILKQFNNFYFSHVYLLTKRERG